VNGRHHLGQFLVQSPLFFGAELAPYFALALAGAALTGFGYSLVYPGLGVEAIRRVAPQNRGLAMGAYTAFLDVALGFGIPALGLLASVAGLGSVFLASAVAALCAAPIAAFFLRPSASATPAPHVTQVSAKCNDGEDDENSRRGDCVPGCDRLAGPSTGENKHASSTLHSEPRRRTEGRACAS
jgi:MFS family permease